MKSTPVAPASICPRTLPRDDFRFIAEGEIAAPVFELPANLV